MCRWLVIPRTTRLHVYQPVPTRYYITHFWDCDNAARPTRDQVRQQPSAVTPDPEPVRERTEGQHRPAHTAIDLPLLTAVLATDWPRLRPTSQIVSWCYTFISLSFSLSDRLSTEQHTRRRRTWFVWPGLADVCERRTWPRPTKVATAGQNQPVWRRSTRRPSRCSETGLERISKCQLR